MRASTAIVCGDGVVGKSIQMIRWHGFRLEEKSLRMDFVHFSTLADFLFNYSYAMFLSVDYKLKINFNNPLPV